MSLFKQGLRLSTVLVGCMLVIACNQQHKGSHGTNLMEDAELIAIYDRGDYDEVYIANPEGESVAHYILIDRGDTASYDLPEGAVVVRIPLEKAIVDSEVYAGAFEELESLDALKGMLDAQYATSPTIRERIKAGNTVDVGTNLNPNAEKIVEIQPDAVLLSYFDGMQTEGIDRLGIPVIKMYDLQESNPLGRAEWIRFIGKLTGREASADSIYEGVKERYQHNKEKKSEQLKPKVLTEITYNGTWSVPGGKSYQAVLIEDAGGSYFKKDDKTRVTLNLSPEQVLVEGGDADFWLIRYYGSGEELKGILKNDPLYTDLKAVREGGIYYSDTSDSGLFREFPFHPDLLLKDYQVIFTRDTVTPLRYFQKLN